jgi:ABC-type transport system involved in multi-copper enzyme maturation permease subunit
MKGLLLKDLLSLRKYARTLVIFILAYSVMTFFMDSPYFLSGIIVLMCSMVAITSFSFDHQAGWDVYALSLPVSRNDVVRSKYLLGLLLTLIGTVVSIIEGALYTVFAHTGSFLETLLVSYALFAVGMLFISILMPLLFKFDPEKARLLIVAVFALPVAALVAFSNIADLKAPGEQLIGTLLALSPFIFRISPTSAMGRSSM